MRAVCLSAMIGVVAVTIALLTAMRARAASQTAYTYRLDTYALQLNGDTQFVNNLEGGFVDGTVVTEATGLMPKKHLAGTTIEPVKARIAVDQFTQFLEDSLEGKAANVTGAVYYIDSTGKVQQERDFTGLILTELAFPTISSASRTAASAQLAVTLAPESVKAVEPLAGALPPVKAGIRGAAKRWAGDFSIQVPGLPTNRVSMIEPFTIRRKMPATGIGELRESAKTPLQWEIPNLVFYVLPVDSQAWVAWHDDFVVKGNDSDAQEKTFTLNLLAPDMKQTLLQLEGTGVGIVSAKYEAPITATTSVSQGFRVELYVESIKLVTNAAPQPATPPPAATTPPPAAAPAATSRPMIRPDLTEIRRPKR